uniref:NADH-ubiquinone oxidoreductase chain 6 n=1 Tax=Lepidodactylus lugubris TaxID=47724 RepID=A0A0A1HAM3_LEPLU|nr:NADH dehydrogenase subunit 6 [Lepidodactylus lugubris]BAP90307.1 NADH dehydrogenase subunit 6 [Lepidodactylus lugubris]
MMYFIFVLVLCFIVGVVGVVSSPSPLYGAASLVLGAVGASGVMVGCGGSFVGLVLLLIYLGGMLVVFAYSVALAADPHPEAWGDYSVLLYSLGYSISVLLFCWGVVEWFGVGIKVDGGLFVLRGDFSGVGLLFAEGGVLLLLCGWGLLLTLFVVLELIRGGSYGVLRVP